MKRSLSLHLAELLRLGCVKKVELLDFAVGAVCAVELIREQRSIGRGILGPIVPVLAYSGEAIRRDRVRSLDHGELRDARTAERLPLQVAARAAVH